MPTVKKQWGTCEGIWVNTQSRWIKTSGERFVSSPGTRQSIASCLTTGCIFKGWSKLLRTVFPEQEYQPVRKVCSRTIDPYLHFAPCDSLPAHLVSIGSTLSSGSHADALPSAAPQPFYTAMDNKQPQFSHVKVFVSRGSLAESFTEQFAPCLAGWSPWSGRKEQQGI